MTHLIEAQLLRGQTYPAADHVPRVRSLDVTTVPQHHKPLTNYEIDNTTQLRHSRGKMRMAPTDTSTTVQIIRHERTPRQVAKWTLATSGGAWWTSI